jgi:uncharacterized protein
VRIARVLFARIPEPGKVKTRLAADLGDGAAHALYRWLLRVQARVFEEPVGPGHRCTDYVYYAPEISRLAARVRFAPDLRKMRFRFRPQHPGDLGERLRHAASQVLADHDLALIWGADIPCLPTGLFEQAAALYPASVMTLARDGGYAFLSVARENFSAAVFGNIRWSTSNTGRDQLAALRRAGIETIVRGKVADLDRVADLTRILRELENEGRIADLNDLTETFVRLARL